MIKYFKSTETDDMPFLYNQFILNSDNSENPADISEIIKRSGKTPYIYIHQSLKLLVEGEYNKSFRLIQYAGKIGNLFYPSGSQQNESFRQTVNLMQYVVIHLSDEFKDL